MIFTLFTASWTTLFAFAAVVFVFSGSMSFFASIASSIVWLIITIIFWVSHVHSQPTHLPCTKLHSPSRPSPPVCSTTSAMAETVKASRSFPCRRPYPLRYRFSPYILSRRCRQFQTVEALGWTALALSALAILAGCFAYNSHRRVVRTSPFFLHFLHFFPSSLLLPFFLLSLLPPFLPSVSIANRAPDPHSFPAQRKQPRIITVPIRTA